MTEFRAAVLEDFGQLLLFKQDIHAMHLQHAPNFYRAATDPLTLEELREIVAGKNDRRAYVLVADGQLAAYAFTRVVEIKSNPIILDQKILFIEDMYVVGKLRRKGCGRRMMEELQRLATQNGCGSVALEVWEWNKEAIAFYKALGLETTQIRMKLWL
jgi:ribosomal protein S18 acetylase RimI-like enzyme